MIFARTTKNLIEPDFLTVVMLIHILNQTIEIVNHIAALRKS
jgi:hypothetical protein